VPSSPARTKRRPQRREQILAAAVQLFHERGYHDTGIDDIGAAAGITGPGVYRHFRSKEEILETLMRERGAAVVAEAEAIVASGGTASELLDAMARSYAEEIVANPSLTVVAMYERRTLTPETRRWIERMERRNMDAWLTMVRQVRPELSDAEARVVVHATLSLGVALSNHRSGLADERLVELVRSMVAAAVRGDAAAGSGH
jgi:AcrR family transcriptional regulator